MSYQTVLVHCKRDEALNGRLSLACSLAREQGSLLLGVCANAPIVLPAIIDEAYGAEISVASEKNIEADCKYLEDTFRAALKEHDIPGEWHVVRGAGKSIAEMLARKARVCDLAIVGQAPEYHADGPTDLPEQVVYGSGRPVLVVPESGLPATVGHRITLAWNGEKEAARAAFSALPLLKKSEHVEVVSVSTKDDTIDESAVGIATALARHGVKVSVTRKTARGNSVAETIVDAAKGHESDLIVMGCYGHSRFHELVFGGVTRHMLATMPIPVLYAQ